MSKFHRSFTPEPQNVSIPEALARAQTHWDAGQATEAEILCQRVLTVWPGQSDALHLLGLMAHTFGNLDLAITYLRQACKAPRAPAIYSSNLAEMCRQKGLLTEGEAAARRAVAFEPALPGVWNNLGIILQESGKFEESRKCLRRVLALQPDNAQAHNNLGNTCKRLGRLVEAQSCWNQALALKPNYAEPHSNLANLLSEQAQYDQAADHARRAIELNPRLADAYVNLAGIETARQRHTEALRWLDALLSFAPMHVTGLSARAQVLKKLDRLDEALDSANRALSTAPENAEAHNAQGLVLQAMGKFEAALAAYDRAAKMPGTAAEQALVNRAIQFMEQGKQTEAEVALEQVIMAFPNSASAWFNLADLKKFTPNDTAIIRMQKLLAQGADLSRADQMLMHFALGKAYLDIDNSQGAFEHLNKGNKAKRASFTYDADMTSLWMKNIAKVFSSARIAKVAGKGAPSSQPIFVIGMPRSGTTLIEQILASHPSIYGAGELHHIQTIASRTGNFPDSFIEFSPEKLRLLGQSYLDKSVPLADHGQHIVDKMPINFAYAGLIHLILPESRIIHCRRDPVDTCLSCYSKLFSGEQLFSYDQTELGRFYQDYQKLTTHWRKVLPPSHFLDVDYEAVVDDFEAQARRMLDFLGLPWNPACLDFHQTERTVRTASVNQVRQPIYRTSKQRWLKHAEHLKPLLNTLRIADE